MGGRQEMRAAATTRTGLDDFGDDWFIGPLVAWAADLEQPNLTGFGRKWRRSVADTSTLGGLGTSA